jgi:hypothetical protein
LTHSDWVRLGRTLIFVEDVHGQVLAYDLRPVWPKSMLV